MTHRLRATALEPTYPQSRLPLQRLRHHPKTPSPFHSHLASCKLSPADLLWNSNFFHSHPSLGTSAQVLPRVLHFLTVVGINIYNDTQGPSKVQQHVESIRRLPHPPSRGHPHGRRTRPEGSMGFGDHTPTGSCSSHISQPCTSASHLRPG